MPMFKIGTLWPFIQSPVMGGGGESFSHSTMTNSYIFKEVKQ